MLRDHTLSPKLLLIFWATAVVLLVAAMTARSQDLRFDSQPTGRRPLGMAVVLSCANFSRCIAIANSGEQSVSVFGLQDISQEQPLRLVPIRTIPDIPSPTAAIACGLRHVLILSPSRNLITLLQVSDWSVAGQTSVAGSPTGAVCYAAPVTSGVSVLHAVVASSGDSSVSVVNLETMSTVRRVPDVPVSGGRRSVAIPAKQLDRNQTAWIAGGDANVISVVDIQTGQTLFRLPMVRPLNLDSEQGQFVSVFAGNQLGVWDTFSLQFLPDRDIPNVQWTISGIFSLASALAIVSGPGDSTSLIKITSLGTEQGVPQFSTEPFSGVLNPGDIYGRTSSARSGSGGFMQVPGAYFLATSTSTDKLLLVQLQKGQPARPREFPITNGASFLEIPQAAGAWATISATTLISQNLQAGGLPLPRNLGGVSVRVGGNLSFDDVVFRWNYSPTGAIDTPLLFVGPSQVNFQVPPGVPLGDAVPVQLTRADGTTLLSTVRITASAPGIFSVLQNGQGQGAVLNQNSTQNFGTNPARRGSVVQIFATGASETTPQLLAGEAAPTSGSPLVLTNVQPTVTIGGVNAPVRFSGMAPGYVGLWQINAEVPASVTPGTAVSLTISAGGVTSNTVTIAVE